MTKRSTTVAIALMGAAAFTLAGCKEEEIRAESYSNLAQCEADAEVRSDLSLDDCKDAFNQAIALHESSAPRFSSLAICEEGYGKGNCESEAQQVASGGGSDSIFMPMMAGYLLGNMMNSNSDYVKSQPLYRTGNDDRHMDATGGAVFPARGTSTVRASLFSRPTTTISRPPLDAAVSPRVLSLTKPNSGISMTRTTTSSRGGFGSTGSSRSGFGRFGG